MTKFTILSGTSIKGSKNDLLKEFNLVDKKTEGNLKIIKRIRNDRDPLVEIPIDGYNSLIGAYFTDNEIEKLVEDGYRNLISAEA